MTMTNKDLTWKLKAQPTAGEVADLVKHGVLTPDEARAIIFNKGKKTSEGGKTTVVHLLIDQSGSMSNTRKSTVDGVNEYINTLKEDGGKYKISLSMFDSDMQNKLRLVKPWDNIFIDDVPELKLEDYNPNGGTPLHDAFCKTLKEMNDRKDEKYLFVVLTDGHENASSEYTAEDMKNLKNKLEAKDNWTFVYLGANQDSFKTAMTYDFSASNTSNFNATDLGTNIMFANLGTATRSYGASASMSTKSYFTPEQQKKNEETK
jgi:Mg-chelatase subunit ChlD